MRIGRQFLNYSSLFSPNFSQLFFENFHIISISTDPIIDLPTGHGSWEIRGKSVSLSLSMISCWLVAFTPFQRAVFLSILHTTTTTTKSLQSCPTLCDPIDGSPPGSAIPGILQARTLEWVAISFSNAWKWKVKVKSLSCVWLFATPWTAAYPAPLSMGFPRQEYWSGVPLPSPWAAPFLSFPSGYSPWWGFLSPFDSCHKYPTATLRPTDLICLPQVWS